MVEIKKNKRLFETYKFSVDIDGLEDHGFCEIDGLGMYGGENKIFLKRALVNDGFFYNWIIKKEKKDITIRIPFKDGEIGMLWRLFNCKVIDRDIGVFDSMGTSSGNVVYETVTLRYKKCIEINDEMVIKKMYPFEGDNPFSKTSK